MKNSVCVYTHTYIYIEREREASLRSVLFIYIYIYMCVCVCDFGVTSLSRFYFTRFYSAHFYSAHFYSRVENTVFSRRIVEQLYFSPGKLTDRCKTRTFPSRDDHFGVPTHAPPRTFQPAPEERGGDQTGDFQFFRLSWETSTPRSNP